MATTLPLGRRERLAYWWGMRSKRERIVFVLFGGVLTVALLWYLVWEPLERDRERLARALIEGRASLAEARRQADEIAGLARNAPLPPAGEARAGIESVLARQGLKPAAGSVERIDDQRWRLTFDAVAFDALAAFLDTLQRDAGVRAAEVTVTGRVEPGQVRAEVTLTRG